MREGKKPTWTNAGEINPHAPVFRSPELGSLPWFSTMSCFIRSWWFISNSVFKRQYETPDKHNMCRNAVVLSYKPRADVPILIKYKVILVQVISLPAQKGSIPAQTYPWWHRSAHTRRLVALRQYTRRLGVIWTTSGGIKSLYPVTQRFILLKFCSCF